MYLGAINVALGSSAAGVFTNSNALWHLVHQSAFVTGDRVWRMPLWKHFESALGKKKISRSHFTSETLVG